jgi:hypothetical protein
MVPANVNGESRQDDVPIAAAVVPAILAKRHLTLEAFRNEARLIVSRVPVFDAYHFLEGNNVGVNRLQNRGDPRRVNSLVQPATLVDVVGDYA